MLEASIAVSYARPFTRSDAGLKLDPEWTPEHPDDLALHRDLMELRHEVYAHTDDTEFRRIVSLSAFIDGAPSYPVFSTHGLSDEWIAFVAPMIQRQRTRFVRERHARERHLGGTPA